MSLPEQIQKQVEQANTIIEQHFGTGEGGTAAQEGGENPAAPEPEVKHVEPAPAAAEPVTPPQTEDENSETYAQRWRSLQGVFNHTQQQLRQYEGRVQQLESLIANMQVSQPAPQQAPQFQSQVTDKDIEAFGDDLIDVARRVTRDEMLPLVGTLQALREEVASLKGVVPVVNTVAQQARTTAEERFFAKLGEIVPDWASINSDKRFHQWLLTPDPLTAITRQTYLEDAQRSHNVQLVANIFSAWKEISGVAAQPQAQGKPNRAASELEKQVAPGNTLSANTPTATPQQRVWSPAEIQKFYEDVRRGVFKGRAAEQAEIERDIFLAQREGRIQRAA